MSKKIITFGIVATLWAIFCIALLAFNYQKDVSHLNAQIDAKNRVIEIQQSAVDKAHDDFKELDTKYQKLYEEHQNCSK